MTGSESMMRSFCGRVTISMDYSSKLDDLVKDEGDQDLGENDVKKLKVFFPKPLKMQNGYVLDALDV